MPENESEELSILDAVILCLSDDAAESGESSKHNDMKKKSDSAFDELWEMLQNRQKRDAVVVACLLGVKPSLFDEIGAAPNTLYVPFDFLDTKSELHKAEIKKLFDSIAPSNNWKSIRKARELSAIYMREEEQQGKLDILREELAQSQEANDR